MKEGENMSKEIKFSQLSKEWLELKKNIHKVLYIY